MFRSVFPGKLVRQLSPHLNISGDEGVIGVIIRVDFDVKQGLLGLLKGFELTVIFSSVRSPSVLAWGFFFGFTSTITELDGEGSETADEGR